MSIKAFSNLKKKNKEKLDWYRYLIANEIAFSALIAIPLTMKH